MAVTYKFTNFSHFTEVHTINTNELSAYQVIVYNNANLNECRISGDAFVTALNNAISGDSAVGVSSTPFTIGNLPAGTDIASKNAAEVFKDIFSTEVSGASAYPTDVVTTSSDLKNLKHIYNGKVVSVVNEAKAYIKSNSGWTALGEGSANLNDLPNTEMDHFTLKMYNEDGSDTNDHIRLRVIKSSNGAYSLQLFK